jgi:hypothetical protein
MIYIYMSVCVYHDFTIELEKSKSKRRGREERGYSVECNHIPTGCDPI